MLKYVWVHRQFWHVIIFKRRCSRRNIPRILPEFSEKKLQLSIGVRDFSACRFLLSRHSSIGNCSSLKNCTSIVSTVCVNCLDRQQFTRRSPFIVGVAYVLFSPDVFFFFTQKFAPGWVFFKFLKVSEFLTVWCFS